MHEKIESQRDDAVDDGDDSITFERYDQMLKWKTP